MAQSILQGGPQSPGHIPAYANQGYGQTVVIDGGAAGGGGVGTGISEIGLIARGTGTPPYVGQGTGPDGTNFCDYDAPTTNPTGYHYLCFSANSSLGGGLITYGAGGVGLPLAFNFLINGSLVPYPPPTSATGVTVLTVTASGTIDATPASQYIVVQKTVPAATSLVLPAGSNWPNCPSVAYSCPTYTIKDGGFNAGTYNITITATDGKTIDGATNYVINTNGESVDLFYNGTAWFVD